MLRTLDPRMKLLSIILLTSLALFIFDPLWMFILSAFAIILAVLLGADFASFFKRMKMFTQLIIVIVILQIAFVRSGAEILTINDFTLIYADGLMRGINSGMRYFIILCAAAIMAGENSRRVIASLTQMHIPYTFSFLVMTTLRFLPMFIESFSDAMVAIQLRGVEPKKVKMGKRVQLYSHLLLPVVADAIIKSKELSIAMEARGFGARECRSAYLILSMKKRDYWYMVLILALCFGLLSCYYIFS